MSASANRIALAAVAALAVSGCVGRINQPWFDAPKEAPAGEAAAPEGRLPEDAPDSTPREDIARQRPGSEPLPEQPNVPGDYSRVPPPQAWEEGMGIPVPVPDRWRIVEAIGINENFLDPYNQNTLKGDRPLFDDWFINLSAISDTVIEPRSFPLPVGNQTTSRPGQLSLFGKDDTFVFNQQIILQASLIKGNTAFKPPDLEFRLTPVLNFNYADVPERRILFVSAAKKSERRDYFIGLQEAFVDYHIRNVSDRYDFDSIRVGIQPFNSDFRGFLFQDVQPGIRLFGTRDNNRIQYNLAWFRRMEKDTNSGLNDATQRLRDDDIFIANVYRQDFFKPGITGQATVIYNRNREDEIEIDKNGFPVRPSLIGNVAQRDYDVVYAGLNFDGRIDRVNLTASGYYAFGENSPSIFTGRDADISAFFAAAEASMDFDWIRARLSVLYASGDSDPFDDTEEGFDAIFENPIFAGADTSYWIRQTIPFIGGGRAVSLNGRNGLLPDLRSSKEQGQSNFVNPGLTMIGLGADMDLTPELRLSLNANYLRFSDTSSLEVLRNQGDIDESIGYDLSAAIIYRPGFIQNFVFRLSGAALLADDGFKDIYDVDGQDDIFYSILFNGIVTY